MLRRKWMIAALVTVAALVAVVAVVFAVTPRTEVRVSASTIAEGTSPEALLPAADDDAVWTSDGETTGAWVEINWNRPTTVDRLTVAAATASTGFTAATLVFDDGSSLHVTPDDEGRVELSFPERSAESARLTIAAVADDAKSVSLSDFSIDGSGDLESSDALAAPTLSASSEGDDTSADALADGDPTSGQTGSEWRAADGEDTAWVQLDWAAPRELASVQIYGPAEDATDPAYSAAAPLHGRLVFDDGSTVVVSGIDGGEGKPTTIAFMPRMSQSVRLELEKTISQAEIGLRELVVNDRGVTPTVWPVGGGDTYELAPDAADDCSDQSATKATLTGITLLCPTPGATVDGTATIVVQSPDAASLEATGWVVDADGRGSLQVLTSATTDSDDVAELDVDTSELASGPIAIKITAAGGLPKGSGQPLYVQLLNTVGRDVADASSPADGMTLQWDDEFDQPLSISYSGKDAAYAATKPQYWGGSEFGEAVLDKPDSGRDTFAAVGDDYLRIRAQALGDSTDQAGWDRRHTSGLLSSLDIGASGFSAQYGYYEARMLGAGGRGTWPAFWMLNTQTATKDDKTMGEVDAVELYGHDTTMSCHSIHQWVDGDDSSDVECLEPNGYDDWAMSWHTYGVQVTPDGADFYIDGDLVMSKTGLLHTEQPFYFMVNLALGGGWPIDISGSQETSDLYVDYIRVYS